MIAFKNTEFGLRIQLSQKVDAGGIAMQMHMAILGKRDMIIQ